MSEEFTLNQTLEISRDHKFLPGKVGVFQFMTGPESEVVVLKDLDSPKLYYVNKDDVKPLTR